jgi:hypothetical protein
MCGRVRVSFVCVSIRARLFAYGTRRDFYRVVSFYSYLVFITSAIVDVFRKHLQRSRYSKAASQGDCSIPPSGPGDNILHGIFSLLRCLNGLYNSFETKLFGRSEFQRDNAQDQKEAQCCRVLFFTKSTGNVSGENVQRPFAVVFFYSLSI